METKKGSLYEFLNKARRRRKYYLHHRLKTLFSIDSRAQIAVVTQQQLDVASEFEKDCLYELRDEYNYTIQTSIPN